MGLAYLDGIEVADTAGIHTHFQKQVVASVACYATEGPEQGAKSWMNVRTL